MKFFFDNNLPPVLAKAMGLIAADEDDEIQHLRIMFDPQTPDAEWLRGLGTAREWVVVSRDGMSKTAEEKRELVSRARCAFILASGFANLKLWILASKLLLRWPDIRAKAIASREGHVYKVKPTSPRLEDITNDYTR